MSAKVLVLGLDAADTTLIERWAAAGDLPTFAELSRRSAVFRLDNPLDTLPEAVWDELHTGRDAGKIGRYYALSQVHTGEATARPDNAEEIDTGNYYWTRASRAGHRVAAIDQVHTVRAPDLNGIQLFEWGLHDRPFTTFSDPPEIFADITARYGEHPVSNCDGHGSTPEGYRDLLAGLHRSLESKNEVLCELLTREPWDLFVATFAESHCVGHQFWHFLDPQHPRHDPEAPADFADAIKDVYRGLDRAVASVMAAAGEEATILIVASHGMGLYEGGYQLLPEVLLRLGYGPDSPEVGSGGYKARVRDWYHELRSRYGFVTGGGRPFAGSGLGQWVRSYFGTPLDGLTSSKTKATAVRNNRVGAIRLNLKGREPQGQVAPGNEAGELIDQLRQELTALKDPELGEPIVARVMTAEEAFGADHHPDVPDLLVVFRTDLGQIEACQSDRVGLIHRPLHQPERPRTGDHTPQSRLWIVGPGVPAMTGKARAVDLAPTVLRLLNVAPPADLDGQAIEALEAVYRC
jgi:predicted AlkP superfamily phosphohydrolase/phosphomutase